MALFYRLRISTNVYPRFTVAELRRLVTPLRLAEVVYRRRYTTSTDLAVALLTTRQANPDRLVRLNGLFGRSPAFLSTIYLDIVRHIVDTFRGFLAWNPRLNDYERLRRFGRAVGRRTGLGGERVWGFVDGTFRPFCKPIRDEHLNYSGHKRRHGFKYQAIATPDGLVSSLSGPYRATENDWSILGQSGVLERFREVSRAFPPPSTLPSTSTNYYI
jgi:hypothetical protein